MDVYDEIIKVVDINVIYCLSPMILTLILVDIIFPNRFQPKRVLNVIRWIIIGYTVITLLHFIIGSILYAENFAFTNRATGPYKAAYWLMFLSAAVLPFSLLIKKLGTNFWFVLCVAFFMKIGMYLERFIIITSAWHRDFSESNWMPDSVNIWSTGWGLIFLQGILLALLSLGVFEIIERRTIIYHKNQ